MINPFTRIFLVSWITLLDSIPDLELVTHLPTFLGGLFKFLSDPNQDVHVATQQALEGFLTEIKRIARVKRGVEEFRKARPHSRARSDSGSADNTEEGFSIRERASPEDPLDSTATLNDRERDADGSWVPGQDVLVDHSKILEILIPFLDSSGGFLSFDGAVARPAGSFVRTDEEIQLTALRWVDHFFEICPEDLLPFVPRLLSHVLPAIAHEVEMVRQAAVKVNTSLIGLIVGLGDEVGSPPMSRQPTRESTMGERDRPERTSDRRDSQARQSLTKESDSMGRRTPSSIPPAPPTPVPPPSPTPPKPADLDYSATVNALTLQFLNEHEQTRVVALEWLIMLHKKAPRKVCALPN